MMVGLLLSLAMYILVAVIFHQRLENTIGMLVQVVRQLRITPPGQPSSSLAFRVSKSWKRRSP